MLHFSDWKSMPKRPKKLRAHYMDGPYFWDVSILKYSKITLTLQIRKLEKGSDGSFN